MEILRVPRLNENMEAAMVGRWRKVPGDAVKPGEPVVELITDKANVELEAGQAGVLRRAAATEKSTVPVGYALAVIGAENETVPDIDTENEILMDSYLSSLQVDVQLPATPKVKATPAARRLAADKGVDLSEVAAAEGDGIIDEDAVRRFAENTS